MTIRLHSQAFTHSSSEARSRRGFAAAAAALAVLALGACSALPERPQRATLYDFGPTPARTAAPAAAPVQRAAITLPDIEALGRLDGTAMLYRLGYADAQALRAYSQARWSQTPAELLRQRLRDGLAQERTVLTPTEAAGIARTNGQVPDVLRITLDEFSHYFDSAETSHGLVRLRATLLRSKPGGDHVVAQRHFSVQRPAPTPDAIGGVKGLTDASDAMVAELVAWVNAQPK